MSGAAGLLETDVDETQRTWIYCTSMAYGPGLGGFVQSFTPLYRALGGNWTSVCLQTSKAPLAQKNVKLPLKSQEEETKAAQTNWLCNIAKLTHLGSKSSFFIDDHSKVDVFWLNKMLIKIGYRIYVWLYAHAYSMLIIFYKANLNYLLLDFEIFGWTLLIKVFNSTFDMDAGGSDAHLFEMLICIRIHH